jgi:hypothetical protein
MISATIMAIFQVENGKLFSLLMRIWKWEYLLMTVKQLKYSKFSCLKVIDKYILSNGCSVESFVN